MTFNYSSGLFFSFFSNLKIQAYGEWERREKWNKLVILSSFWLLFPELQQRLQLFMKMLCCYILQYIENPLLKDRNKGLGCILYFQFCL